MGGLHPPIEEENTIVGENHQRVNNIINSNDKLSKKMGHFEDIVAMCALLHLTIHDCLIMGHSLHFQNDIVVTKPLSSIIVQRLILTCSHCSKSIT